MTYWIRKPGSLLMLLAVLLSVNATAWAQTSVVVEVRVVEISRTTIESLKGPTDKPGFATTIPRSLAESLVAGPQARVVHRIELPVVSGASTQVRLDSRISVTSSNSGDTQTYFDAGIGIEATPKVFQNRDISLATASQVRIRRGPDAEGTPLVIFENPATRVVTRIHEGESIILGGFITPAERMTLPDMPMLPDSPLLNYLYQKGRLLQDPREIAIVLTPRIVGLLIDAAIDPPAPVSKSVIVSTPVTSTAPPAPIPSEGVFPPATPMTLAALNPSPGAASPALSINSSSPVSTPVAINRSPVVSSASPAVPDSLVLEGTGGKYTVQVGAFDKLDKAEALRAQLARKFEMVFVEKVTGDKPVYRVRVGRFPDLQSARKIEKQLVSERIETYLTTLN